MCGYLQKGEAHKNEIEIVLSRVKRAELFDKSPCETVLDQLYQAYAESHESAPPEITEGFQELEKFLCNLPLENNNTVFNLCCRLCSAYEHKAFVDGFQYGSNLMLELNSTELGARNQSTEEQ